MFSKRMFYMLSLYNKIERKWPEACILLKVDTWLLRATDPVDHRTDHQYLVLLPHQGTQHLVILLFTTNERTDFNIDKISATS